MYAPPIFSRVCPAVTRLLSILHQERSKLTSIFFLGDEGSAARNRGFDKIRQYAARMKREILISFLPPVLLSVAIRLGVAANAVFRPDVSIGASQEWVLVLAVLAGVPALIVFAAIRLWIARAKLRSLGAIVASALLSAVILIDEFRRAILAADIEQGRIRGCMPHSARKTRSSCSIGARRPGPILFSRFREYLVIAKGGRVQTFEAFTGHVIDSWGDERERSGRHSFRGLG